MPKNSRVEGTHCQRFWSEPHNRHPGHQSSELEARLAKPEDEGEDEDVNEKANHGVPLLLCWGGGEGYNQAMADGDEFQIVWENTGPNHRLCLHRAGGRFRMTGYVIGDAGRAAEVFNGRVPFDVSL